jgi:hypothetical protein
VPRPDAELLARVPAARAGMADPDERMVQIVGVNRQTVVAVRRTPPGFEYGSSPNGDGTVPVSMALVPGLETYYVDELHGNLTSNSRIIGAVADLIRDGRTRALEPRFTPKEGALQRVNDVQLRRAELGKVDWRHLSSVQREAVMTDLDGAVEEGVPDSASSLA